jgi:titin
VTNTVDSGPGPLPAWPGSLRACIDYANLNAGTTITFDIPDTAPGYNTSGGQSWWRISPGTALPVITASGTIIDGTTQATNYGSDTNSLGPEIEINGALAPAGSNGLVITSANNTFRHLVVNGFLASGLNGDGIQIDGAGATGNLIAGCYVGTNATGNAAVGNGDEGIVIWHGASGNTIGGNTAADRNVISGNDQMGVLISDSGTDNNVVIGNYIGTDADGTADLGNLVSGVRIVLGADNNTIGGTAAGEGNVISGNNYNGIHIVDNGTSGIIVQGNYIGLDKTGLVALGNNGDGIEINDANNVIGGTGAGEGNVIAFNGQDGVYITGSADDQNLISGNSIFSNGGLGIDLTPNGVGVGGGANNDKAAPVFTSLANSGSDLVVTMTTDAGDVVEFFRVNNAAAPVVSEDPTGSGEGYLYLGSCVDNGVCSGPYMVSAVDADAGGGTIAITLSGIVLSGSDFLTATATDSSNNTSEFAANNVLVSPCPTVIFTGDTGLGTLRECISYANANPATTIDFDIPDTDPNYVTSGADSWWRISPASELPHITASGTVIDGATQSANYGSDTNSQGPEIEIDGTNAGNNRDGLTIAGGSATIRSLIVNRYTADGIQLEATGGNVIQDCYIGVDPTGTSALANGGAGILISATSDSNAVGGPGVGNIISGNGASGINIGGDGNVIQGNFLGTDPSGTTGLGNTDHGILLSAAAGNVVGGQDAGEDNVIAFNGLDGLFVTGGGAIQNLISGNSLFSNGELGIDLAPNGVGVGPSANSGKEAPVFSSVAGSGVNPVVTLTTDPGDIVEFFRVGNSTVPVVIPDGTGSGEGFLYLGACTDSGTCSGPHMISAADGDAAAGIIRAIISGTGLPTGDTLTATATDTVGNTSEFAVNAVYPLILIKQAFLASDGSPISSSSTLPRGTLFRFLIYTDNPGPARSDVSIQDVLDPAFAYSTESLKVDNSVASGSTVGAIYTAVNGTTQLSDVIDADVASISGNTIDVGNQFVGNGPLDIAANRIWALLFTVRMQ